MPATTSALLRAARPAFRQSSHFFTARQATQNATRNSWAGRAGRRWQSTQGAPAEEVAQSWIKKMWDSPIGIKTVHFWAPVMKWSIVLAGISDFYRPAESLSLTQNAALTATGLIWTRWCLIIKPRNILLATVNFFLGVVGVIQVVRILSWQNSQKNATTTEKIEGKAEAVVEKAKQIVKS